MGVNYNQSLTFHKVMQVHDVVFLSSCTHIIQNIKNTRVRIRVKIN